jgi:hypothetical protein
VEGALTVFVVFGYDLRSLPVPEHIGQQESFPKQAGLL